MAIPPAFGIVSVIVLVLLNGFFVATEFSLVAVRRSRIEQLVAEGHRTARAVKGALEHLDTYIAATQLGITMASLALGWLGEPALAHLIEPLLVAILPGDWVVAGSHAIAVAVAFAIITTLHIVLGELAPKGVALQKPEATALWVVVPISIFLKIFKPFILGLNGVGNLVLRLFGLRAVNEENVHSVEELRYLVRSSHEAGILESAEESIISKALTLGDLTAYSVMVPRTSMVTIPVRMTQDELLDLAGRVHHVRFPVYKNNNDNIVGVLHLTDIFAWQRTHSGETFSVEVVMRSPLLVPETIKGDGLLAQMRAARSHTAIVLDEYGGVSGLVTLQDLLEKIVGDIPEMDEVSQPDFIVLDDGSTKIDGLVHVDAVKERFGLTLDEVEAETIGGYVMEALGRLPQEGDEVILEPYKLRVTSMAGHRVAELVIDKE